MVVSLRLCRNVRMLSLICNPSITCRIKVKIDKIESKSPNTIPIIFEVVSDVLMKGVIIRNTPPSKKNKTPKIDLLHIQNLCFMYTTLSSAKISKQTWFAIFNISLLIVVIIAVVWLWSSKLVTTGFGFCVRMGFGIQNCHPMH